MNAFEAYLVKKHLRKHKDQTVHEKSDCSQIILTDKQSTGSRTEKLEHAVQRRFSWDKQKIISSPKMNPVQAVKYRLMLGVFEIFQSEGTHCCGSEQGTKSGNSVAVIKGKGVL
jgi:hypothetical protein